MTELSKDKLHQKKKNKFYDKLQFQRYEVLKVILLSLLGIFKTLLWK